MSVNLITITPKAQEHMLYCARVSNPKNQLSSDTKLLSYCIKHGHYSIFEQATMTVEINTSRAISAQLLRHHSFRFQEFSQRYCDVSVLSEDTFELPDLRLQDKTNRQSSIIIPNDDTNKIYFTNRIKELYSEVKTLYDELIFSGIAKESARYILPMSTRTRLYMTGNIRDWLFYIKTRTDESTQKEHRDIANQIKTIIAKELPIIYNAIFS